MMEGCRYSEVVENTRGTTVGGGGKDSKGTRVATVEGLMMMNGGD